MRPAVIDVHAHWIPDSALAAARAGHEWHGSQMSLTPEGVPRIVTAGRASTVGSTRHFDGVEARLADMDGMGVEVQVLSILPPFFRYGLPPATAVIACREANDDLRRFVDRAPDRLAAWGILPLQADPSDVLGELTHIRTDLGFLGAAIGTHVAGVQLADGRFNDLWEALAGSATPVFVHPPAGDRRALDLPAGFFLDNVIGNPTETTIALTGLVLGGIFERYPGLTVIAAHGGGYFPTAIGRIEHAIGARRETGRLLRDRARWLPAGLLVDTLTHSAAALRFLVDQLGASRLLVGTDYPSDMGEEDPVGFLRRGLAGVRRADINAILGGNAQRILPGLVMSTARAQTGPERAEVGR